jgi:hypothetical protein
LKLELDHDSIYAFIYALEVIDVASVFHNSDRRLALLVAKMVPVVAIRAVLNGGGGSLEVESR